MTFRLSEQCVVEGPRCWHRYCCASIFSTATARGRYKRTRDGSGRRFTSGQKDRGHGGPSQKQHKPHNNQSGCGHGYAGAEKVWNNTTISRQGWTIQQTINNKFISGKSSWPESTENKHNNQPDRIRDSNSNEWGWWGEEGVSATTQQSLEGSMMLFFSVMLVLKLVRSVIH